MDSFIKTTLSSCRLCPRNCGADRTLSSSGFCKADKAVKVARAALHYWEEPCISGQRGSGTVFFSHCTLGCVFCQNREISHNGKGVPIDEQRLAEIFLELQAQKAHNINLVTPTHYAAQIITAIGIARKNGLELPIVYNCGGYEKPETIRMLSPYVDVWMPDFKYAQARLGEKYSNAPYYPEVALTAIGEMLRLSGPPALDESGMLQRGVLVRHLLLPGKLADAMQAIALLYERFGDDIILSLMSQYTPPNDPGEDFIRRYPELMRKVSPAHYAALIDYAAELGITRCFVQDATAASGDYIPDFADSGGVQMPLG